MIPLVRICRSHALPALMTDPEDRRGPANHHPGILASRNPRLHSVTQTLDVSQDERPAGYIASLVYPYLVAGSHTRPVAATNLHNSRGTLSTHARCVNCELGRYATPSRGVGGYTYGGIVQGPWREASSEKLDSIVPSDVLRCVRFVRGDLSSFLGSGRKLYMI